MNYLVVGAGGTGGCIGAYLALAGWPVTFIARGEHLQALRSKGLVLHSRRIGERKLFPVQACQADEYTGMADVIFVCVKSYSLLELYSLLQRAAGRDSVVIPVVNVFGTGERLQVLLPQTTVADGCVYIFGEISAPGEITQSAPIFRVVYGLRKGQDNRALPKLQLLQQELAEAGIDAELSEHIKRDTLKKFSFVSALGAAGLYFNAHAGDFQQPGEKRNFFFALNRELIAVAEKMGVYFDCDLLERNNQLLMESSADAITSMQRDVAANRPCEFSGLVGEVVRLGKRYGVPTPCYRKVQLWGQKRNLEY